MKPIVRNVLGVLAGALLGSLVNGMIVKIGYSIVPPPAGANLTTPEGFEAAVRFFEPKHFVMPFLAHALGTFVGAFTAARIAVTGKMRMALIVGFLFFLGGLFMVAAVPAPFWFDILDLSLAYFPMAYLGGMLTGTKYKHT